MRSRLAPRWTFVPIALLAGSALAAFPALAAGAALDGTASTVPLLGSLALILVAARLGGELFERMKLPAVLGELLAGVLLGNLGLVGFHGFDGLASTPALTLLAELGVLFLLFAVGLESDFGAMKAVGPSALAVAVLGVAAPLVLGFFCSRAFFPAHDPLTHWFVGATLCATSVGITARVLADLGRTNSAEGRIILGAAVIDDVLGLIVLAVVSGVITAANSGRAFEPLGLVVIIAKAVGFLAAAIVIGRWLARVTFRVAARVSRRGVLLALALAFCFALAALAGLVGLAPIVGAFAAGLVLEKTHTAELVERDVRRREVAELMEPLTTFLTPVFFVLMGLHVDLRAFGAPGVAAFAGVLTLAAIAGKQACALGVFERGADRLAIGLGMIPRGEVGLIFAGIGATLEFHGERVVDGAVYSAVIIMVTLTTLVTPPLLAARLARLKPPPER
jgi:Kef-type K+ transport system membrane component KefB